jgi:hypothetical protein
MSHKTDGKEFASFFCALNFARPFNFPLHPLALNAFLGKHQQQPVVQLNRAINLGVKVFSTFHIFAIKPNTQPGLPHPCV